MTCALRREASLLAGGARGFGCLSELFSPATDLFTRLAFLFAGFACLLSDAPDLLRFASGGFRLREDDLHFRLRVVACGILAAGFRLRWDVARRRFGRIRSCAIDALD